MISQICFLTLIKHRSEPSVQEQEVFVVAVAKVYAL